MRLDLPGDRYTRATTRDYSKTTVGKSVFAPVEAPTIDVPLPGASRFEQTLAAVARRLGGTSPTATQGARPILEPSAGAVKPIPAAPPSAPSIEPIPSAPSPEPSIQPIPPAPPSAPSAPPQTATGTGLPPGAPPWLFPPSALAKTPSTGRLMDWGLAPGKMPGEYTPPREPIHKEPRIPGPITKPPGASIPEQPWVPVPPREPGQPPEWRQIYAPPLTPPTPVPPPPEAIKPPVPVEGVAPRETPASETPKQELRRGPGGFEREVPMPIGFSLPTPERLAELWQEVTGRPATEEERRYFQSPQFLRVLSGRIPMWQVADPIWRRFFQLLGIIRNRLEG